jgi:transposase-like protein
LPLKVPQTRDGQFYPQSLERGLRSERALLLAIAEMYVQGVSTRRVKRIVEELCGLEVSSSQVSRAAAELDAMLEAWRNRDLGCYRYIVLDAQYEKVRQGGQVLDAAILMEISEDWQTAERRYVVFTDESAIEG